MEFVSLGSVVNLGTEEKDLKVVIIGRMLQNEEKEIYEYVGVLYPYGYLGGEEAILFKHDDIQEVVWEGYVDSKEEEYNKALQEAREENI